MLDTENVGNQTVLVNGTDTWEDHKFYTKL